MVNIAFIGLGHMGNPMVKNLLKNNYSVKVYDLSKEAIANLAKAGAIAANSVADVVKNADVVITMLQTGQQVKQVCFDKDGIFLNIKKSAMLIECSSIDVASSRAVHEQAKAQAISMVDAPVSGGVMGAQKGTLTFMVGGNDKDFERAKIILNAMGKKIIYAGQGGSGAAAKICNNMVLAISMTAISEAFVLADRLDLAPEKLFEICSNASAQCWSLTSYCPWPGILPDAPSSHDYKPGFNAKMMLKDLNLSQDAAESVHLTTPLAKLTTQLYQKLVESEYGEEDFSAIIRLIEKQK